MSYTKLTLLAISLALGAGNASAQHVHGGHSGGHGGNHDAARQGRPQNKAGVCPLRVSFYKTGIKNLDNGVEITLVTEGEANIARLRELAAAHFNSGEKLDKACPAGIPGAKTAVEEADGGVKITITGRSPTEAKEIQAAAAAACKKGESGAKRAFKTYVCPMGEYQSSKPGKCPKCGMELEEKK